MANGSNPRRTGNPPRPTQLGEFLRELRQDAERQSRSKMSQDLFQETCLKYEGPKQYVAKIEGGRAPRELKEGFLQAVVSYLAESGGPIKSEDELRSMYDRAATGRSQRAFRVIAGHCVWTAPLVIAAYDGLIPEFTIKTFAKEPETLDWIGTAGGPPEFLVKRQVPSPACSELKSLSARVAIEEMKNEAIDMAIVPEDAVPHDDVRFLRVGCIVDCATGCTLVTEKNEKLDKILENTRNARTWGTKTLKDWLNEYLDGDTLDWRQVRVGVESDTVAVAFLEDALAHRTWAMENPRRKESEGSLRQSGDEGNASGSARDNPASAPQLTLRDVAWDGLDSSSLAETSYGALKSECSADEELGGGGLIGVITWEPHATWLQKNSRQRNDPELEKILLQFDRLGSRSPRHLTFEIVVRGSIRQESEQFSRLQRALPRFVYDVDRCAKRLNEARDKIKLQDTIKLLAWYFGLLEEMKGEDYILREDPSVLEQAFDTFSQIRYAVRWYPDALQQLGLIGQDRGQ